MTSFIVFVEFSFGRSKEFLVGESKNNFLEFVRIAVDVFEHKSVVFVNDDRGFGRHELDRGFSMELFFMCSAQVFEVGVDRIVVPIDCHVYTVAGGVGFYSRNYIGRCF